MPTDARVFLISITEAGVRALESVQAARRDILEHSIDEIDDSHLAVTADVLRLLAQRLSTDPVTMHETALRPSYESSAVK